MIEFVVTPFILNVLSVLVRPYLTSCCSDVPDFKGGWEGRGGSLATPGKTLMTYSFPDRRTSLSF